MLFVRTVHIDEYTSVLFQLKINNHLDEKREMWLGRNQKSRKRPQQGTIDVTLNCFYMENVIQMSRKENIQK